MGGNGRYVLVAGIACRHITAVQNIIEVNSLQSKLGSENCGVSAVP
jgi:hypothetical protein